VVAIKVLLSMISASMGVERFLREIQIMRQLRHRNILQILDAGAAQGLIYYVMPYVSGPSLRDRLDDQGSFPIPQALSVARATANALDYAHAHDVVHRDIKPENVLFDGRRAKVNDFGIAIAMSKSASERITEPGLVVGTAAYMSPEQAYGDVELDGRSDEYGLGCVVYEMLCGETPFTGMTTTAIMRRKVTAPLPSLSCRGCDIPPELDKVVAKSLARERRERFATAGDFVDALTEAWANSN
jgi:serine/threonine-protein kinase